MLRYNVYIVIGQGPMLHDESSRPRSGSSVSEAGSFMRVQVVAAGATSGPGLPLSTFVVDDVLAIDAGALGWFAPPARQATIHDVFLTHSHIDHIAGLAVMLDNVYGIVPEPPRVHGLPATLKAIQDHVFNDCLMPDFIKLSETLPPFLTLHPLAAGAPVAAGKYTVTAYAVDHSVPTVSYVVDDGTHAFAILTDTAPVPHVIEEFARIPRLRAVFLEASFPNQKADLAAVSLHHTSEQFLDAARGFPPNVKIFAIHIKPRFAERVTAEIEAGGLANVEVATPGQIVDVAFFD